MRAGKCLILSDVGGNPEFNVNNNILMVDVEHMDEAVEEMMKLSKDSNQHICTSCGSIAKRWKLSKAEFLSEALEKFQQGVWFGDE